MLIDGKNLTQVFRFIKNRSLKFVLTFLICQGTQGLQDEKVVITSSRQSFLMSASQLQRDQSVAQGIIENVVQMYAHDAKFPRIKYSLRTEFVVENVNAWYSPTGRVLNFPYVLTRKGLQATARDHGIVSHEAGHMTLDVFQPSWLGIESAHIGAIHEAFSDLTAHFYRFHNPSTRQEFLRNLQNGNGCVGDEQLTCVRNNHDPLTLPEIVRDQSLCEVHELSRPFSNAVYDNMVTAFANRKASSTAEQFAASVVAWHRKMLVHAVLSFKESTVPTLMDVSLAMLDVSLLEGQFRNGLGQNFINNGLIVLMYKAPTTYYVGNQEFIGLCQQKHQSSYKLLHYPRSKVSILRDGS